MEVKNALTTQKYTKVCCEDQSKQEYGAPHHFEVYGVDTQELVDSEN